VIALLTGRGSELDVPGLILGRREQHAQWNAQDAPGLVIGEAGAPTVAARASELTGIGCSPGAVEGIARVLADSSQASQLQPGEILVAPHTDPGWTPLFLTCSAVVTEIGGFLSHGATVAREYGIPAVMNVIGATTRIHTGDRIRVDGSSGRIVLVDPAKVSQAQSDVGSISHA
jgi:phosphoenolpyruvate synthase/pyruvate phosphate dikinase